MALSIGFRIIGLLPFCYSRYGVHAAGGRRPTDRCSWYAKPPTPPDRMPASYSSWLCASAHSCVCPDSCDCPDRVPPNSPNDAHLQTRLRLHLLRPESSRLGRQMQTLTLVLCTSMPQDRRFPLSFAMDPPLPDHRARDAWKTEKTFLCVFTAKSGTTVPGSSKRVVTRITHGLAYAAPTDDRPLALAGDLLPLCQTARVRPFSSALPTAPKGLCSESRQDSPGFTSNSSNHTDTPRFTRCDKTRQLPCPWLCQLHLNSEVQLAGNLMSLLTLNADTRLTSG
jgi:hypothetical protein